MNFTKTTRPAFSKNFGRKFFKSNSPIPMNIFIQKVYTMGNYVEQNPPIYFPNADIIIVLITIYNLEQ